MSPLLFDGKALLQVFDGDLVVVTAEIQFQKVRQCGCFYDFSSPGMEYPLIVAFRLISEVLTNADNLSMRKSSVLTPT